MWTRMMALNNNLTMHVNHSNVQTLQVGAQITKWRWKKTHALHTNKIKKKKKRDVYVTKQVKRKSEDEKKWKREIFANL